MMVSRSPAPKSGGPPRGLLLSGPSGPFEADWPPTTQMWQRRELDVKNLLRSNCYIYLFRRYFGLMGVFSLARGPWGDCAWSVAWAFPLASAPSAAQRFYSCMHPGGEAMARDLPDLDASLAKGDPSPATNWMCDRVQVHGGLRTSRDTIAHATGADPGPEPLLRYLEAKFGELYAV